MLVQKVCVIRAKRGKQQYSGKVGVRNRYRDPGEDSTTCKNRCDAGRRNQEGDKGEDKISSCLFAHIEGRFTSLSQAFEPPKFQRILVFLANRDGQVSGEQTGALSSEPQTDQKNDEKRGQN